MSTVKPDRRPRDVFAAMPARFNAAKAPADFKGTYVFIIGNEPDAPSYTLSIVDGRARIDGGTLLDVPIDLTITIAESDFMDIVNGRLTGQRAFTEGTMKLDGNLQLANALPLLFD